MVRQAMKGVNVATTKAHDDARNNALEVLIKAVAESVEGEDSPSRTLTLANARAVVYSTQPQDARKD
jgi:hypothetical protein